MNKGYNEGTGLYISRYYARKDARYNEVVVKVDGGYTIKTISDYKVWRNQK